MTDETVTQPVTDPGEDAPAPSGAGAVHSEDTTGEQTTQPTTEPVIEIDDVEVVAQEAEADRHTVDELHTALREAERLRDEYLDQAQRSRAEYQNLRRRSNDALATATDKGAERLITQLFSMLDNFSYVIDAITDDDDTQLAKGVRMVYAELNAVLETAGLEPIPGVGSTFDPTVHDALLSEESDTPRDEPVVTEVLRPGYRFKGRTLRPASVKVAR